MPSAPPPSFLPLVAYAEALCAGARVLFIGDARSEIALRLLERGARLVHVCDEVAARRAEGAQRVLERAITFGALNDGSFALREGFFDLALVENLASHSEPKAALAAVSRLLAPRGTAVVAAPNPQSRTRLLPASLSESALDYYALYDAVAGVFPRVRMLGQVPFVGYAVVDFASEGEPEVVFDASLISGPGEEPDYFVAVAGEGRAALDGYAVIQLSTAAVLDHRPEPSALLAPEPPAVSAAERSAASAPEPPPIIVPEPPPIIAPEPPPKAAAAPAKAPGDEAALRRQEAWIAELEARAVAADERADAAEAELDELRERFGNLEQRTRIELDGSRDERKALTAELERNQRQKHDLTELLKTAQSEAASANEQLRKLQSQLAAAEARASELAAHEARAAAESERAATHEARALALEAEVARLSGSLAALSEDSAASHEVQKLESQLAERGDHVRALERQLREAERTGRELLRRLERTRSPAPAPVAAGKTRAAGARVAELEAERQVLAWALAIAGADGGLSPAAALPPLPSGHDFRG